MSDVFISYSRKNSDFVHKLNLALTNAKRDVWVDWADIGRGQDWWHEIELGVDSSDTALIIVSENWLVSEICQRELEYIRKQNKRVFPIIYQRIEDDVAIRVKGTWMDQDWEQRARDNWKYLRSVNWLFFDDPNTFDSVFQDLLAALDTDQAYVKNHTRYFVRATEWQQSHRNPSFLLEGEQVAAAEDWLKSSVGKTPEPHPAHHEYIKASQVAETARITRDKAREGLIRSFRKAAIVSGLGVIAAIIVALVVGQQFIVAREEVTRAGATLQQVNLQVTEAINQEATAAAQATRAGNQVGTAVVEQGQAVVAQQTSAAREASANQRVIEAGATLSPVAPTLAAVSTAINFANHQQDIALFLSDASLQIANGESADAIEIANEMVSDYPDEPLAYMGRGLILNSIGDLDAALADYSKAIELNPTYDLVYYNRAIIYEKQGQLEEAVADYTKNLELDPGNSDAYLYRALIYTTQGKLDEALSDYWAYVPAIETNPQTLDKVTAQQMPYSTSVTMAVGDTYRIPFEAKAGDTVEVQAVGATDATVDPLIFVLDPQGKPLDFNDNEDDSTTAAYLVLNALPVDGVYTLLVTYSSNGADGDVEVTLDVKPLEPTLTPTPK